MSFFISHARPQGRFPMLCHGGLASRYVLAAQHVLWHRSRGQDDEVIVLYLGDAAAKGNLALVSFI